jgi:hypothetical protein
VAGGGFSPSHSTNSGPEIDHKRVEELIDLNMQDLVFDDEFIEALDEQEAVSIQVTAG